MQLATIAHAEQVDKNGRAYVGHLIRVAARMRPNDAAAQIVALLHDVVEDQEDKGYTLENLATVFPPRIIKALDFISRRKGERYFDYLERIKSGPYEVDGLTVRGDSLARAVKIADLRDNLDERRRYQGDDGLRERYQKSLWKLRTP
jgi:(p)ppGpp synthase/HD superfamily hydrolase